MAILPPPLGLQFVKNSFTPSNIASLSLWLKADAGVTTSIITPTFISQIIISGAGETTSNGTYTRASGGNTSFTCSNGNSIEGSGTNWFLYDATLDSSTYANYDSLGQGNWETNEGVDPEPSAVNTSSNGTPYDGVTAWSDQSGNGNDTDDYGGYSPRFINNVKNGKPVIRFGAGGDTTVLKTLGTNLIGNSGNFTVIAAYNYNHSGNVWAGVFSKGDFASEAGSQIDFEAYFINGDNGWTNVMGVMDSDAGPDWVWSSTTTLHDNEWIIHEGISDVTNNSQKMFINTSEVSSSNSVATINALNIKIGIGNAGADSEPLPPNFGGFQGDIAEIIVYDKALTTPERQQVEAYLNTKYAIY